MITHIFLSKEVIPNSVHAVGADGVCVIDVQFPTKFINKGFHKLTAGLTLTGWLGTISLVEQFTSLSWRSKLTKVSMKYVYGETLYMNVQNLGNNEYGCITPQNEAVKL